MDWIAYTFFTFQMILLAYKPKCISEVFEVEKLAFAAGGFGCLSMIVLGIQINSIPMIILNTVLCFLNLRGYIK